MQLISVRFYEIGATTVKENVNWNFLKKTYYHSLNQENPPLHLLLLPLPLAPPIISTTLGKQ